MDEFYGNECSLNHFKNFFQDISDDYSETNNFNNQTISDNTDGIKYEKKEIESLKTRTTLNKIEFPNLFLCFKDKKNILNDSNEINIGIVKKLKKEQKINEKSKEKKKFTWKKKEKFK